MAQRDASVCGNEESCSDAPRFQTRESDRRTREKRGDEEDWQDIHFGESKVGGEGWEWVRKDRVYLCGVSCHLCVRAHHRNCEACVHTSTITLPSAGHQHWWTLRTFLCRGKDMGFSELCDFSPTHKEVFSPGLVTGFKHGFYQNKKQQQSLTLHYVWAN